MPGPSPQATPTLGTRIARRLIIDAGTPRVVRRLVRWSWACCGLVVLTPWVGFAAIRLDVTRGIRLSWMPVAMWAGIVLAVALFRLARRPCRRAARADHLLCPECLYDLRTLAEAGVCPECGRAYEREAVRAQWKDAERRLKRQRI